MTETTQLLSNGKARIFVATSPTEFAALRDDWRVLRKCSPALNPATDPNVFAALFSIPEDRSEPHVVLCRRGTSPCALLLGRIRVRADVARLGYLRIQKPKLRHLDVEYGGLATDGSPGSADLVAGYCADLLRRRIVDCMTVNHLPCSGPLYARLGPMTGPHVPAEPHWRFRFAAGPYSATMARFSRNHRHNIRRKDQLLTAKFNGAVRVAVFDRSGRCEDFIRDAAHVASQTYQVAIGAGFGDTSFWRTVLHSMAEHGLFRSYLLIAGERPIAFQVGCVVDNVYCLFQMGYLPEYHDLSPGSVLHCRVLEDLRSIGIEEIDYGFGDSSFKRIYGTHAWDEVTLHLCGRGVGALVCNCMEQAVRTSTALGSWALNGVGYLERVKRAWRSRAVACAQRDDAVKRAGSRSTR